MTLLSLSKLHVVYLGRFTQAFCRLPSTSRSDNSRDCEAVHREEVGQPCTPVDLSAVRKVPPSDSSRGRIAPDQRIATMLELSDVTGPGGRADPGAGLVPYHGCLPFPPQPTARRCSRSGRSPGQSHHNVLQHVTGPGTG